MDKLVDAYKKLDFFECDELKQKIRDLREILNEREVATLSIQIPKISEDSGPSLQRIETSS